jgi:hypothetical protein
VDSADFVDTLRKSRTIEPVELFSRCHICVDVLPDERAAENPEQGDADRHTRSQKTMGF